MFGAIKSLWYFNIRIVGQTRLDSLARDYGRRVLKLRCGEPWFERDFMKNYCRINDISEFPRLKSLHIAYDATNNAMLTFPHSIRHLSFSNCHFDDRGLQSLPSANLQSLSLCECPNVTDAGISHFENLRHLKLNHMEQIQALSFPPQLETVALEACSQVVNVPALPALRTLSVQYCHAFQGSALCLLSNLHVLHVQYCYGFQGSALCFLSSLKVLRVKYCRLVQESDIARISEEYHERGRVLVQDV
jgi:hypothetical protein